MNAGMIRTLGSSILLILVAIFFIYDGFATDQILMIIVGVGLLILGIVRFIIFRNNWKKQGDE